MRRSDRRHGPGARRRPSSVVPAAAVLCALGLLTGCPFGALQRNLEALDQNGQLHGTVARDASAGDAPLVVFAARTSAPDAVADDWVVLRRPGPFFLVVPIGEYRVGAFADRNHSLAYEPGEPVVWAGEPIVVGRGASVDGIALTVGSGAPPAAGARPVLPVRSSGHVDRLPASRIGEIVTLDDARFSDVSARLGLWQPNEFLVSVGAGIYFLEPYDPRRTPVLFVHGALGHPANFRTLVAGLDRSRYQAWFAFYPSSAGLQVVGAALGRWLQALEAAYHFDRLAIVAHSMGGLVSRAYLIDDPNGLGGQVESLAFVTIATPWRGHAGAARGVERAPVVAPAWFDLAPGSAFLNRLLDTPLPRYATHDLYFAYGGSRRRRIANDGVVTVASQLDLRAQRQAREVMGFDAGHSAVLDDPELAAEVWRSLAGVAPR